MSTVPDPPSRPARPLHHAAAGVLLLGSVLLLSLAASHFARARALPAGATTFVLDVPPPAKAEEVAEALEARLAALDGVDWKLEGAKEQMVVVRVQVQSDRDALVRALLTVAQSHQLGRTGLSGDARDLAEQRLRAAPLAADLRIRMEEPAPPVVDSGRDRRQATAFVLYGMALAIAALVAVAWARR